MRWNAWLAAAAVLAAVGLGSYAFGQHEAATCRSAEFLGCLFVGVEAILFGLGLVILALPLALVGWWRGAREARAAPMTRAQIEAEIARVDAELAKLSRRGS